MSLKLSPDANPAFFSKNWINEDAQTFGVFTASEMQAIFENILDGDPLSIWQGTNAVDGTPVVLTVQLMEKGANVNRLIDLTLFQNINWKNFLIEKSIDGGANYTTVPGGDFSFGTQDFSGSDFALAPSSQITANALRVTITHTQNENEVKRLGGWIAAELKVQLARGFTQWRAAPRANINEVTLGNGRKSREYFLRSTNTHVFWGADYSFTNITQAEVDILLLIQEAGDPFVVYIEPGERPRQAYEVFFRSVWMPAYTNKKRSLGYSFTLQLEEAVGA